MSPQEVRLMLEEWLGSPVDWAGDTSFLSMGWDSLQIVEAIVLVEDAVDAAFPDQLLASLATLDELVEWCGVVSGHER